MALSNSLMWKSLLFSSLHQAIDGLAELLAVDGALTQFLTQTLDAVAVLHHRLLDKLHVLAYHRLAVGTLAFLGNGHTALGLADEAESLLYLVEGGHHVVYLVVLLVEHLLQ